MDENLPEEYRLELAKAFVNDLFTKVKIEQIKGIRRVVKRIEV
jgi:hypothetical protein